MKALKITYVITLLSAILIIVYITVNPENTSLLEVILGVVTAIAVATVSIIFWREYDNSDQS